jgi:glycosyltransferase involved in cell wall biosynthesis
VRWLFLRGRMERHKECAYTSLDNCDDTWEELFASVVADEDTGKVLYSNGHRRAYYRDNFCVEWIHKFSNYSGKEPDIIVARGGFKEYVPLLKDFPKAYKVYYGANHGCIPADGIKYDLVLCDSEEQKVKAEKHGYRAELFIKPASHIFEPHERSKKYDVCFVALCPEDARKNVKWVYQTKPKGLKMLQLGRNPKKLRVPNNVTIKHIDKASMPKAINKCKVLIAPYKSEDSCPRVIPEALACGVPVIALKSCQFWRDRYPVVVCSKDYFWDFVRLAAIGEHRDTRKLYEEKLSIPVAAQHLRGLIDR